MDGLVRVREQEVRDQQRRVASAARAHEDAKQRRDARRTLMERTVAGAADRFDPAERTAIEEDRAALRRQLRRDEETLSLWAEQLRQEQVRLEQVNKRKEAVLKLRERRYLEFVREVLRSEQKEHDEIAARIGKAA